MPKRELVFAIDLGSFSIKSAVGQIIPNLPLQIIAKEETPSAGIRRGDVIEVDEVAKRLQENLERLLEKVDREGSCGVAYGGMHFSFLESKGVVAVSRADGEITEEDKERAIEAGRTVSLPSNKEILETIVRGFSVDKESGIKNPVGMTGVRLEAELFLILVSAPYFKNLKKCLDKSQIEVSNFYLSGLAAEKALLSRKDKEAGCLLLDIGAQTTKMCIFEEGELSFVSVLPLGSFLITNDIAIAFQIPLEIAERLKVKYAFLSQGDFSKKEEINLKEIGGEDIKIKKKTLIEVVEARVDEILEEVLKVLKKAQKTHLPGGVILCGGGALLPGIEKEVKKRLKLPARIGYPQNIEGIVEIDNPAWATIFGILLSEKERKEKNITHLPEFFSKIKKWFKNLLP